MAKRPKSKEFGARLAEIMGERTQEQFAAELEINRPQLARYLAGRIPDPEILKKISIATGRSLDWLLLGHEEAAVLKGLYDAAREVRAMKWDDPNWPHHYAKAHHLIDDAERDVRFLERTLGMAESVAQYGHSLFDGLDAEGRQTLQQCADILRTGDKDTRQHIVGQIRLLKKLSEHAASHPAMAFARPHQRIKRYVTVLSPVAAGRWRPMQDPYPIGQGLAEVETDLPGRYVYALKVEGDSMEPAYHDGEIVFVDPEQRADEQRALVIVKHANHDDVCFKQLVHLPDGRRVLHSFNQAYADLQLQPGDEFRGRVVAPKRTIK